MAELGAHKRKVRFFGFNAFEFAQAFNGSALGDVATQGVNGIGWINDDAAITKAAYYRSNIGRLNVFIVNTQKHSTKLRIKRGEGDANEKYN